MGILKLESDVQKMLEYHVECAYQCSMLLDEHDELLREFCNFSQVKQNENNGMIYVLSTSVLCGTCLYLKTRSKIPLLVSSIPLGIHILKDMYTHWKYKNVNNNFLHLTTYFRKIFDMNKIIKKYYQKRKITIRKMDQSTRLLIDAPISNKLNTFIKKIANITWKLILFIKKQLEDIGALSDVDEFAYVYSINFMKDSILTESDVEEEILISFDNVQMCYVMATSAILCGLCLSCSRYNSANKTYMSLFSKIIPDCLEFVQRTYQEIKNEFEKVSYRLPQVAQIRNQTFTKKPAHVEDALSNLNEHFQLSFNTVVLLQNQITNGMQLSTCWNQLHDIENLLAECSSTLNFLQTYANKSSDCVENTEEYVNVHSTNSNVLKDSKVVYYDDTEELVGDEEFNLSIHGSDVESDEYDNAASKLEYEQLREQVRVQKLIISELNNELERRNFIKMDKDCGSNLLNKTTPDDSKLPVLKEPSTISDGCTALPNDILAHIRAVAQTRGVEEAVFGDESFSSDSE